MKKILTFFTVLLISTPFFAKPLNALDTIAKELVKSVDYDDDVTIVVGGFTSDLKKSRTKQIEQALQIALFNTNKVEIIEATSVDEELEGVDYLCTGTITEEHSSYLVTAKLIEAHTGKLYSASMKQVAKSDVSGKYESNNDSDDEWEKWFWATVIVNSAVHHHHPAPPAPPKPAPKPSKPRTAPGRPNSSRAAPGRPNVDSYVTPF